MSNGEMSLIALAAPEPHLRRATKGGGGEPIADAQDSNASWIVPSLPAGATPRHTSPPSMKTLITLCTLAMLAASTLAADEPIRHVVHFKFKKEATPEQIKTITDGFAALKGKISEVEAIEWGTNASPEGLDKGFTHCWIVSFKNAAGRDAYLVHPAHKAFVELLMPSLDEALVVDFVPKK